MQICSFIFSKRVPKSDLRVPPKNSDPISKKITQEISWLLLSRRVIRWEPVEVTKNWVQECLRWCDWRTSMRWHIGSSESGERLTGLLHLHHKASFMAQSSRVSRILMIVLHICFAMFDGLTTSKIRYSFYLYAS